jgi:hypothetical protein
MGHDIHTAAWNRAAQPVPELRLIRSPQIKVFYWLSTRILKLIFRKSRLISLDEIAVMQQD